MNPAACGESICSFDVTPVDLYFLLFALYREVLKSRSTHVIRHNQLYTCPPLPFVIC
jgi:hypothetical protein